MITEDTPNYASTTFPAPRPFQVTAHDKLREGAKQGHRCQVIMAPTGAGKTYLAMRIIQEALMRGKRCMFVCDRKTLINQASETADILGLSAHGIIQADHWRANPKMPFQIASVQTLMRRTWPETDVIVIDECHCQYKSATEQIKATKAHVLGLSASPFSAGLGQIYSNLINAATMNELTEQGILVPMRVFSCTKIDMKGAETRGGEWTEKAAETRGMEIIGNVVQEWEKFAILRKTIVFGATIAHCEEMRDQFLAAGHSAAVFCATTTDEERVAILSEYRKPDSKIRILISVEALAKGFDVPDVECVCDCRPLRKSLSTAVQMWGRGLRSSPNTGKEDCLLLDFSGNIIRFADDFSDIFFKGLDALDMGEKLDKTIRKDDEEKEPPKCPKCGYQPMGKMCVQCGYERKQVSEVPVLAGSMKEITLNGKKLADDTWHLYQQVCTYTKASGNPATAKQRAFYLYRDMAGKQPPNTFRFEDAHNVPITQNVANKIKQQRIAYAKRRGA
jgi:DNA repair protein RadD